MEDFEPAPVVVQVEVLRMLMETRDKLQTLLTTIEESPTLDRNVEGPSHDSTAPQTPTNGSGASDAPSLLDMIGPGGSSSPPAADLVFWEAFQAAPPDEALRLWRERCGISSKSELISSFNREIASLDALLTAQVNAILQHSRFQQLEASWRGLNYLLDQVAAAQDTAAQIGVDANIKIRLLSVSKRDLLRDLTGAIEFDQSAIFRKVYDEEFGTPGGEPYGVLLGDYQFSQHPDDVDLLSRMSEVAAAAFAPFISSATPGLLGLESFQDLQSPMDLAANFRQLDYLKWNALRDREDSRFLGMFLPRVLMRRPYENDGSLPTPFCYREETGQAHCGGYLWGSSVYAFASVLTRSFSESGWFAEIRGVDRDHISGGAVTGLPTQSFGADARNVAMKSSLEINLPDDYEVVLDALGFGALCHCQDTNLAAFYATPSLHRPKRYDTKEATNNAKISAMLQYVFCASRFAHYLKVMVRDTIGSGHSGGKIESDINNWLAKYITSDELAKPEVKAKFPLRDARVEVRDVPGKPGEYRLVMHLLPHFQLDQLTVALRMVTRLASNGPV